MARPDYLTAMQPPFSALVSEYNGRPTIHLNGQPVAPIFYALPDTPGGSWSFDSVPRYNMERFRDQGVRLFQVDLFFDHIWRAEGEWDLSLARKQLRGVLEVCPEAAIMIRLHANAPRWWEEAHPETWTGYDEGEPENEDAYGFKRLLDADPRRPARPSMASTLWRETMTAQVQRFCRELGATNEGGSVASIQIAYGVYGEWHQWGMFATEADRGVAMTACFRSWLTSKYHNVNALNAAWDTSALSVDEIEIPTPEMLNQTDDGLFRYSAATKAAVDYYSCAHERTAENILHFCRVMKESWPRPLITGAFYGYFFCLFNRQAYAGHLGIERVLKSADIDFLSGPNTYAPESGYESGEPYRSRSLNDAVREAGKLWLDEYDQQPRRTYPYISADTEGNLAEYRSDLIANIAMIRRNILYPLLKGQGLWFYDFGPSAMDLNGGNRINKQAGISQGYWDHRLYFPEIKKLVSLANDLQAQEYENPAELLVVYDTEVLMRQASTRAEPCPITTQTIDWLTASLFYTGVPFRTLHRSQLDEVDLGGIRAVLFANTFQFTATERSLIRERFATDGRHLLWTFAPGYLDEDQPSMEAMQELTGIKLMIERGAVSTTIRLDDCWGDCLEEIEGLGELPYRFSVEDEAAQSLGYWSEGDGVAFARRELGEATSWFVGTPIYKHWHWRALFTRIGLHAYHQTDDVLYAGAGCLAIHTRNGGEKTITLRNGKVVNLTMPEGPQTVLLDAESGKYLVPPWEANW